MPVNRVAFAIENIGQDWIGGINYFHNLFSALQELSGKPIEIVIFTGIDTDLHGLDGYGEVVRTRLLGKKSFLRNLRRLVEKITARDVLLYMLLRNYKIDVLSHSGCLWKGSRIPALVWITDFQYKHLPHLFDKAWIKYRDNALAQYGQCADAILLSSYNAKEDWQQFFPLCKTDAHVLQFVSRGNKSLTAPLMRDELASIYELNRPWFHLPNQFWAHKNHAVVVEALRILKSRGHNPLVVATGNTSDVRNLLHFSALMRKVEEWKLQEMFRVLGIVPYDHVISLMWHSIAAINPSLFEGWSSSVEEAKSMGKKILLSDIAVHQEQAPERAHFFAAEDAEGLAALMIDAMNKSDPTYESKQAALAQEMLEIRRERFAQHYKDIISNLSR